MATTDEVLVSVIEADAACNTHFGVQPDTRLYPETLKQGTTYPAATYSQPGGTRVNSFDGINPLNNPLMQIDVYATTKQDAKDAAKAIRDAVDESAALGAVLVGERGGYEDQADPRLYRVSMDFSLWHDES